MKARTIKELKEIRENEAEDTIWKAHYFLSIADIEEIINNKIHELELELDSLQKNPNQKLAEIKSAQMEVLKSLLE